VADFLTAVFELIPAGDILYALLIVGLMYLNWSKDRLIREMNVTLRDVTRDFAQVSELMRTLVYGRKDGGKK